MFPLPILSHRRFDFRPYPSYLSQDATTRSLGKPLKFVTGIEPVSTTLMEGSYVSRLHHTNKFCVGEVGLEPTQTGVVGFTVPSHCR